MAITAKQQKANRKKWVKALRSGKYRQTKHYLVNGGAYCCLGVLASLAGVSDERMASEVALRFFPEAMEFVGLKEIAGEFDGGKDACLAVRNDHGASFSEIADIIESEPTGLFTA
jgi:hypothetical protein